MLSVLCFAYLIICAICAFKESKLTSVYKANNVYGRVTAYLALDFLLAGVAIVVNCFLLPAGTGKKPLIILGSIAGAIVFELLGVLMYAHAYKKCPPALKKKCIPSMIMSGLGIAMKMTLFFLPFVWKLSGAEPIEAGGVPNAVRDEAGNICRVERRGREIYIRQPNGSEVSGFWDDVKYQLETHGNYFYINNVMYYIYS